MSKIFVVGLERLENRYTCEWYDHIPNMLENIAKNKGKNYDIVIVNGDEVDTTAQPGSFLNFGATNIFKSAQLSAIANEFHIGKIKPGDKFLFTDAWNPTVLSVKYMSELMNIPIHISGLHHAGSWDKHDFLGRLNNKNWIKLTELSMFEAFNTNWFATDFHYSMFLENMFDNDILSLSKRDKLLETKKVGITGWPMEYMKKTLSPYTTSTKKQQVVFPHRLAPEKQLEIFKDLEKELPEYNWVVCQEKNLTKKEYHSILGESKIIFSASLQETLGISTCQEGPFANCIPMAPNRLSYSEIFKDYEEFLYPSEWTIDFHAYTQNKTKLINRIQDIIKNYDSLLPVVHDYNNNRANRYFNADALFDVLID